MGSNLKYGDLTEKIIGCAMTVHKKMGPGYNEVIYSRCLAIEFDKAALKYQRELEWPVFYDEIVVGKRRVDFFVEEKISVEIKAIHELSNKELAQGLNYLESHKMEIGLLLNFGAKSLQFKRLINEQKLVQQKSPDNPIQNPVNPRL
jgi:GxxExxY protein